MSVIVWSPEELGNVARFLAPTGDAFGVACKLLAAVSRANVAEFVETYAQRHGTPEAATEQEIREGAPGNANRTQAIHTLELLDYNAQTNDSALRAEATGALAHLLTLAVRRLGVAVLVEELR
jgi:hypothetical protein